MKQLAQEILQQPTHIYYIYIYTKEVFVATTNLKIWQLNLKETGGVWYFLMKGTREIQQWDHMQMKH